MQRLERDPVVGPPVQQLSADGAMVPLVGGVWAEVSQPVYQRVMDLWDEAGQAEEPPLAGRLANELPDYPSTLGLPGSIHLLGPSTAPEFRFPGELDHPLAREQQSGVYPERALEWVARFVH